MINYLQAYFRPMYGRHFNQHDYCKLFRWHTVKLCSILYKSAYILRFKYTYMHRNTVDREIGLYSKPNSNLIWKKKKQLSLYFLLMFCFVGVLVTNLCLINICKETARHRGIFH